MSEVYIEAAAKAWEALLPSRDKVEAAQSRLRSVLANAARDGFHAPEIDDQAFQRATARIAAKTSKRSASSTSAPGIEGTPLGDLITSTGDTPCT